MKKKITALLITLVLVMAIPVYFVMAAPSIGLFNVETTPEATETPPEATATIAPEITLGESPLEVPPEVTVEPTMEVEPTKAAIAHERIAAAKELGISPGRLLLLDRLASLTGKTRAEILTAYGTASTKEIMRATNEARHSDKGKHKGSKPTVEPTETEDPTEIPESTEMPD